MLERRVQGVAVVRALGCGLVAVAVLLTVVAVGQARVGDPLGRVSVGTGALAPVTFNYTGTERTYTVPAGVSSLQVQAVGANGQNSDEPFRPATGGTGGMVTGELAVARGAAISPGETLYVAVGGSGSGMGGYNGGGKGGLGGGGGGGGASDVRTCSRTSAACANRVSSPLTRLIVAAGGGGAGSGAFGCGSAVCEAGGSAGQPGSDKGTGGGAGTLVAPGGPGAPGLTLLGAADPGGTDGTGGTGGFTLGGSVGGGGGGAGYYGGGGGAVTGGNQLVAGGGGGGANFASPFVASSVAFRAGDGTPRLLITPRPASAIRVSRIYYNSPGPDTATDKSLNAEFVRLKNTSRTVWQLRGWSISDTAGHVYRFGGLRLRPGGSVTIHTGRGRDTRQDRYWNRRGYVWDNTRGLVRVHTARGSLADQCRYDNSRASQLRC
jgi:hypothetical protein